MAHFPRGYVNLQRTLYWQTDLIGFFAQSMSSQPAFSRFPLSSATNFIFTQFWRDQAVRKHFIYTALTWAAFAWLGMMFESEMWIQLLYLPSTAQQYSASFRSRLQEKKTEMLNKTIGNPPPEHIPVSVPFELSIVAGQDIGWVNIKICEILVLELLIPLPA